jgi:DNA repair photolyase
MEDTILKPRKGRGAIANPVGRYEGYEREAFDDGWDWDEEPSPLATTLTEDASRTIIARNDSPDIGFDQSINPYRGCEHGCIYCFARPSHAYLGLSPGLDFESRLFYKPRAPELLEAALRARNYKPSVIVMGSNTDPYQPVEREQKLTRRILEVLLRFHHPVAIVTKSALVARDTDLLAEMAALNLARVAVSITTLDPKLARTLEPRAASPARRLATLRELSAAGIPTTVMAAPMIPGLNDPELDSILEAAAEAGAGAAGTTLIRLPLEIKDLFEDWLKTHVPGRAAHVMSLIRQCHAGKPYRSDWGTRMTGDGHYAVMLRARFERAAARLGLNGDRIPLRLDLFSPPPQAGTQLTFF